MRITEIQAKKGKRKRDLIVVAMNKEDFDNMKDQVLMGEFYRGQVFIVREEREEEFIEILKGEQR
jgi:hypothetical protein